MSVGVGELDAMPAERAAELLSSCCGSRRWVSAMVAERPFGTRDALAAAAGRIWWSLSPDDWREAFAHHPRIGDRAAPAAATEGSKAWSAQEQSRVDEAAESVRLALADINAAYEDRFGYTYIVRAAGRTAEEMLTLALERMANDAAAELRVAAEQQREIMQLRIDKLLTEDAP